MSKSKDRDEDRPSANYEVGFGKPPKHTRWRKGQSGNPKGRKKGSQNMVTHMREIFDQPILVRKNGVERHIPYKEALIARIASKGLTGSMKDSLAVMKTINDHLPELLVEDPSSLSPRQITVRFVTSDGNGRPAPGQGLLPGEDPARVTLREVFPAGRSSGHEPEREPGGTPRGARSASAQRAGEAGREDEERSEEGATDDLPPVGDHGCADDDSWLD